MKSEYLIDGVLYDIVRMKNSPMGNPRFKLKVLVNGVNCDILTSPNSSIAYRICDSMIHSRIEAYVHMTPKRKQFVLNDFQLIEEADLL